jgi:hypothetical protein
MALFLEDICRIESGRASLPANCLDEARVSFALGIPRVTTPRNARPFALGIHASFRLTGWLWPLPVFRFSMRSQS